MFLIDFYLLIINTIGVLSIFQGIIMLILTRKLDESITIGDEITITVLEIEKGHVRLGINAPKHVAIYRNEIYERIQEENIRAAKTSKADLLKLAKKIKRKAGPFKK